MKRMVTGVMAALLLAGCGGSSGPHAPVLHWAAQTVKTFSFTWADVKGETGYRLLEDPDGVSGYSQIAVLPADATEFTLTGVPLPSRINARYLLQACDDQTCADSAPVYVAGNLAAAVGYLKASNPNGEDVFGASAALSDDGNTLAVGTYSEDSNATGVNGDQGSNAASDSGAVYVFTRSGNTWSQQAYVKASNAEAGDWFGAKLALSGDGNTLAVGARQEDSSAAGVNGNQGNNGASNSGAVYVFTRSGNTWSQQAYVKASNAEAGDLFGYTVALSGNGSTLAVAAALESSAGTGVNNGQGDNSAAGSGAVYIFTRSGGAWSQQAYLKASNTQVSDFFGTGLALSNLGNTLAVSAYGEDSNATGMNGNQNDNSATDSGAVYVFVRTNGTWSQQAYVKASDTEEQDRFGGSLALSGNGNTLAVGTLLPFSGGAAYLFTRDDNSWTEAALLNASNTEVSDGFGYDLALSDDGDSLVVSAIGEDSNATGVNGDQGDNSVLGSGAAYLFTRRGGTWTQQAYIKASNPEQSDQFGEMVALSGDGLTLVVGATGEDSYASGVGGDQADNTGDSNGAVYLY